MAPARTGSVSVVLPVYNRAAYVGEAIESVLSQTCPPAELIVIDDGSTDESLEIVASFARPCLRVVRQANAGIGAARNRGLALATGELIGFIDSDDLWERGKLERQVRATTARSSSSSGICSSFSRPIVRPSCPACFASRPERCPV